MAIIVCPKCGSNNIKTENYDFQSEDKKCISCGCAFTVKYELVPIKTIIRN